MRRKAGVVMASIGLAGFIIMGCCLDGAKWAVAMILAIAFFCLMVVGMKLMDVPEVLNQKGIRFESRAMRMRKEMNSEKTWEMWKQTW